MSIVLGSLFGVAVSELIVYRRPTNTFHICTFAIAVIAAVKHFGIFQ
nr:MAG TPA: hypothetical protein [Caudoviricetes sp.]